MSLADELSFVHELAVRAGEAVMRYADGVEQVDSKEGEPVTLADLDSDRIISAALRERFPDDVLLTEESPEEGEGWRTAERVWIVDPLDGTSDFKKHASHGRIGFAVMIGLVIDGRPTLGVVHAPAARRTFLGLVGEGAWELRDGERHELRPSTRATADTLRCICSIEHRDAALERALELLQPAEALSIGSVGMKVGKICADEADMYIAPTGHIKVWDTAAPEAILHAAGGRFVDCDGQPLNYRGPGFKHPRGLLATNGACVDDVVGRLQGQLEF